MRDKLFTRSIFFLCFLYRLEEALAKLGWIALRDVKGEVDAVTFEAWWKVVSVVVNIFYY